MNVLIIACLFLLDLISVKILNHHTPRIADILVAIAAGQAVFSLTIWEQTTVYILTIIYMIYRVLNERREWKKHNKGSSIITFLITKIKRKNNGSK